MVDSDVLSMAMQIEINLLRSKLKDAEKKISYLKKKLKN